MVLKNRECDAAVVAGANLVQLPEQHMATVYYPTHRRATLSILLRMDMLEPMALVPCS
jgi:hypothetical protein